MQTLNSFILSKRLIRMWTERETHTRIKFISLSTSPNLLPFSAVKVLTGKTFVCVRLCSARSFHSHTYWLASTLNRLIKTSVTMQSVLFAFSREVLSRFKQWEFETENSTWKFPNHFSSSIFERARSSQKIVAKFRKYFHKMQFIFHLICVNRARNCCERNVSTSFHCKSAWKSFRLTHFTFQMTSNSMKCNGKISHFATTSVASFSFQTEIYYAQIDNQVIFISGNVCFLTWGRFLCKSFRKNNMK